MTGVRSKTQTKTKTWAFDTFQGLDSSRDITAQDTGSQQHLWVLENASCDFRGQIERDGGARQIDGQLPVQHVNFFGKDQIVYAEVDGAGTHLRSSLGHVLRDVFETGNPISSTVFNRNTHFVCRGGVPHSYDGAVFKRSESRSMQLLRPAFVAALQRRMIVAGIPGLETEVHISRVDNPNVFPNDEADGEANVLRAGVIDVGNFIGSADRVTGLGAYEQNRLVIFTADQALIYQLDPDINQWRIDNSANIRVGCVSHNTIQPAGTDLLFCSRKGVHSIRRSAQNGIMLASVTLSDKVDLLYRQLFRSVTDKAQINAVYDQDRGQYHIFFPQPGGTLSKRLTLTIQPASEEGAPPSFSTGDFLHARCGAFLDGMTVFGTTGGCYEVLPPEDDAPVTPDATIQTPYLWHGSLIEEKQTYSLTLQAAGKGVIELDAIDLNGRDLGSLRFEIDADTDDDDHTGMALSAQYERPWQRRYLAASYRIRILESRGLVRVMGFAIKTLTE